MATLAAGIVDPTKAGKYRVVLSDALLGKDSKELYTGIRYNHKPLLSSSSAPHQARLKPSNSAGSSSSSFDLSFQDGGGRYAYQGTRAHEENQYVLIFEPEKEVFVLHRLDSLFNMNLTRTPTNNDAEDLRQEYPHLDEHQPSRKTKSRPSAASAKPAKSTKSKQPAPKHLEPPKPVQPAKSKKAQRHDSEDESSDDDLLTIEDPGGAAPTITRDFSPAFIEKPQRFADFIQQRNEEEDDVDSMEIEVEALNDADGEEEEGEEDDDDASENFKLPSPIHRQMMSQNINGGGGYTNYGTTAHNEPEEQISDEDEDEEMMDVAGGADAAAQDDIGADLEEALLAELAEVESDVSEEE